MLTPLKFKPLYKERIWGGRLLESSFKKKLPKDKIIGESWELSGVEGDESVVCEGNLKGNSISELIEIYMDELVGDKVFKQFGHEFPLLIKLIDAQDYLSVQVHPDDKLSAERHNAYGKTEMWYVLDCQPDAELLLGFNREMDVDKYVEYLEAGKVDEILTHIKVKKGDAFFIPAGAIHAIGKGILIAEIQQTSDITYRVFDYNRVDSEGNPRELHTQLALDAIDFSGKFKDYNVTPKFKKNEVVKMQSCKYFATNVIDIEGLVSRDYDDIDSFIIYIALEGDVNINWGEDSSINLTKGETLLIPAILKNIKIEGNGKIIETYVP